MNRRDLLRTLGTAGIAGLAGCNSSGGTDTPTKPRTETTAPPETPQATHTKTEQSTERPNKWEIDPLETDKLVGAYYYGWYRGGDWNRESPSTPVLGEYGSRNEDVINQHIKWALEHGINTFIYRWGGPGAWDDTTLREHFLEAELGDRIDFMLQPSVSSLYPGDDYEWGTSIDFDDPRNRQHLKDVFTYMDEEFFGRDNYARLDGRPPVVFFGIGFFRGGDFPGALREAKRATNEPPFLVGDFADEFEPHADLWLENANRFYNELIPELDAVTTYTLYNSDKWDELKPDFDQYREYMRRMGLNRRLGSDYHDVAYIPPTMPGYDDSMVEGRPDDRLPIEPTPDRFEQLIDSQQNYIDPDLDAVFITSFNEWYEDTIVEPDEETGTAFLDVAAEDVAGADWTPIDVGTVYDSLRFNFSRTITPEGSGRHLAWMIGAIDLYADRSQVASYDIGNPEQEPILLHGFYPAEENPDSSMPTRRWTGGPLEEAVVYVEHPDPSPTLAEIIGSPIEYDAIEVDVYYDGRHTDSITLDERDDQLYEVSLSG